MGAVRLWQILGPFNYIQTAVQLRRLFFVDDPWVEHELFLLSWTNLPNHCIGQVLLSSVVAAGSWGSVEHRVVLAWCVWMSFSCLALAATWLAFRRRARAPCSPQTLRRWCWSHVLALATVGIAWGGAGFLFAPLAHDQNLMVMIAFSGVFAYSAASNAPQDPLAFTVSAVIGTVILMTCIPAAFGSHAVFVLTMCVLYFFSLAFANSNARRTLLMSISLRLANEALAKENAENATRAEQANRDKSDFLAAASHDLRQPVHALLLLIEAYKQQVPAASEHPLMRHILEAGRSIRSLFNALMELSRLDSGSEQVVISTVHLPDVLQRLHSRVMPQAQRKGLSLRCVQSPRLRWSAVRTDGILLERIVANLLSNAVRYTEQGGVLLSLRPAHGGSGWWLEVWDTGIGIAEAEHTRIFNPYVQVGNSERDRSNGLGLGLAIVRHCAALLGVSLHLRSVPGRGSRFRLHLPLAMCQYAEAPGQGPHQDLLPTNIAPLLGRRVLLVEDDPMALHAMQVLLRGWGIDLHCAQVGDASVLDACAYGWVPECVLCDFRLPGPLDGVGVLDLLLEQYPHAVGILQTGELEKRVLTQAEDAGYMVLFKPVDPAILASTLDAVLERKIEERPL